MSLNLYFKTNQFDSNKAIASYFCEKLLKEGLTLDGPEDEEFMYSIKSFIDGEVVVFYVGKNDEESTPALWQIWPEHKVTLLKRMFSRENPKAEEKAKSILEKIVNEISGVTAVEWGA